MTYLESITFLTGRFLQISQFALKNAYRVISLTQGKEKETPYMKGSMTRAEACEAIASAYLLQNRTFSGQELLVFFQAHPGLSNKDFDALKFVLNKRDYLVSYFFIENSPLFAREEIALFESKITELKEYVDKAEKLNVSLSKACDRLYESF